MFSYIMVGLKLLILVLLNLRSTSNSNYRENFKDINIGSPIYMAPEGLIHNIYGPKTDIWAFGILIFELLHGETPYAHCRSETELKNAISSPITHKKLRS